MDQTWRAASSCSHEPTGGCCAASTRWSGYFPRWISRLPRCPPRTVANKCRAPDGRVRSPVGRDWRSRVRLRSPVPGALACLDCAVGPGPDGGVGVGGGFTDGEPIPGRRLRMRPTRSEAMASILTARGEDLSSGRSGVEDPAPARSARVGRPSGARRYPLHRAARQ